MAPRPSSPTISYLPAFVTVGIIQSICCPARAAHNANNPRANRVSSVREENLTALPALPPQFRGLSAEMPPPTPGRPILTVPSAFSRGQRYWGTSVSHSIRASALFPKLTSLAPVTVADCPTLPQVRDCSSNLADSSSVLAWERLFRAPGGRLRRGALELRGRP